MKKPPISIFIDKIASKLKFVLHGNIYERPYKIKDIILDKIIHNKLLTCNVHISDGTDSSVLLSIIKPYMANTISQFVHLSFTTIDKDNYENLQASTGSKFENYFITQGAELKSSLNIKILIGVKLSEYIGHEYFLDAQHKHTKDLIGLNIYFVLYMRNGIKTCYAMDYYEYEKMVSFGKFVRIENQDSNLYPTLKIKKFIQTIANLIIKNDFSIYGESNAGFQPFYMYVQIIDGEPKIKLCKTLVYNNYKHEENYVQHSTDFSKKYYNWLCNCVIFPHFGLLHAKNYISPIAIELTNNKLNEEILSKLILQFNDERTLVDIYLLDKKIGFIKFKEHLNNIDIIKEIDSPYIFMHHIELEPHYRKKNISVNVLFLFMEILSAYYAPLPIVLATTYCKHMHKIAFELEFTKIFNLNIYIRKCRQ
jgi:hypothetical protein